MTWYNEHDEIVARYVSKNMDEHPEQSAFTLFCEFRGQFEIQFVLRKVRYWRGLHNV